MTHDERRRAIAEHLAESRRIGTADDPVDAEYLPDEHVYVARRCIRCNTASLDVGTYPGLEGCPGKYDDEPIVYSTSSDGAVVSSHDIDLEELVEVAIDIYRSRQPIRTGIYKDDTEKNRHLDGGTA